MIFRFLVSLIVVSLVISFNIEAQLTVKDSILGALVNYSNQFPQKKVYIKTDRDYYIAGEKIWYSFFLINKTVGMPENKSNIAYVDLISCSGEIIEHQKIELNKGHGKGCIDLQNGFNEGIYILRAYTNWMHNLGKSEYFRKEIAVYSMKPSGKINQDKKAQEIIKFYPESGKLINGLITKVAFRLNEKYADNEIFIIDNTDNEISLIKPIDKGIGMFMFKPEAGKTYFAKVDSVNRIPLPQIWRSGLVMNINNQHNDNIDITIYSTPGYFSQNETEIFIIALSGGSPIAVVEGIIANNAARMQLPRHLLKGGINELGLFSGDGKLHAHRIIHTDNPKPLVVNVTTDKTEYKPREKVRLEIAVSDKNVLQKDAIVSVSVNNEKFGQNRQFNIDNYMALISEMTGNAPYHLNFLESEYEKRRQMIDCIMLMQKQFSSTFEKAFKAKPNKPIYNYETRLYLHGRVKSNSGNINNESGKVAVYQLKDKYLYEMDVNSQGFFSQPVLNFTGERDIVFSYSNTKPESKTDFEVFDYIPTVSQPECYLNLLPDEKLREFIDNAVMRYRIKASYFDQKDKNQNTDKEITGIQYKFYDFGSYTKKLDDYITFPTMEEVIREIIPEAKVRKSHKMWKMSIFNEAVNEFYVGSPLILLDGIPVKNIDYIMNLKPADIEQIDVISSERLLRKFGIQGQYGVFAIYSKTGELYDKNVLGNKKLKIQGLTEMDDYKPKVYVKDANHKDRIPDFRPVLYWNPHLKTNSNGKAIVEFYTSDETGKFIIEIDVMTQTGKTAGTTKSLIVEYNHMN